jgi:hypothetical protein
VLIDQADLEAYAQVTFPEALEASVEDALARASAAVETHCRRRFTLVEDDAITLRWRPSIVLPDPPVIEISSFSVDGRSVGYDIDASGRLWPRSTGNTIGVTYTHGFAQVPEIAKLIACRIANRIMQNPSMRSTYTGPDGLNYATPTDVGPRIMTGDEATALRHLVLHKAA